MDILHPSSMEDDLLTCHGKSSYAASPVWASMNLSGGAGTYRKQQRLVPIKTRANSHLVDCLPAVRGFMIPLAKYAQGWRLSLIH